MKKSGDHDDEFDLSDSQIKRTSGVSNDPNLYRIFFRTPDKLRSLEDAQVFISHIKFHYGPLTQYQFSRCPETQRYFGYGFLTFKNQESHKKAVADGYIRVGLRDFEIKSTGHMPSRRVSTHMNTGFSGFYNLKELRANKAKREREEAKQATEETRDEQESPPSTPRTESNDTTATSEPSVSALSSSFNDANSITSDSEAAKESISSSTAETAEGGSAASSTSFSPSYPPAVQKKGLAQLWKTIPARIEMAEQSPVHNDEEKNKEESSDTQKVLSSADISESVGRILNDL
ncbi:hypothetical protein BGX27_006201 [Mortierella sp. AM989]|nr:hypothetical protein BGX27_006201 [Mortierella sp. AM989]